MAKNRNNKLLTSHDYHMTYCRHITNSDIHWLIFELKLIAVLGSLYDSNDM